MTLTQYPARNRSRPAFTFVIIPLILAICMIILGVIYAVQHQQPIVPNAPRQPAIKVLTGATLFAGWLVVMASGWAEKKGHRSANILFGVILLLGNLAMLNAVTGWSAKMRAQNQGQAAIPITPQPTGTHPFPSVSPPPQLSTNTPLTPAPDSTPSPPPSPSASTATPPPPAPLTRPRPQQPEGPDPRIAQDASIDLDSVAEQLSESLNTELAARSTDAAAIYKILEKPRHDRKQLDEQIAVLSDLQKKFKDSATRFRSIGNEFADLAEKAGASRAFSMPRAFEFARDVDSFERAVACDRIARACDSGTNLLILLRDNISKWTYNSKGEVVTKDKSLEHRLFGPKAQVGFVLKDKIDDLARLNQLKLPLEPTPLK